MNKTVSTFCLRMYDKNSRIKIKLLKTRLTLGSVFIFFPCCRPNTWQKLLKGGRADLCLECEGPVHHGEADVVAGV